MSKRYKVQIDGYFASRRHQAGDIIELDDRAAKYLLLGGQIQEYTSETPSPEKPARTVPDGAGLSADELSSPDAPSEGTRRRGGRS